MECLTYNRALKIMMHAVFDDAKNAAYTMSSEEFNEYFNRYQYKYIKDVLRGIEEDCDGYILGIDKERLEKIFMDRFRYDIRDWFQENKKKIMEDIENEGNI